MPFGIAVLCLYILWHHTHNRVHHVALLTLLDAPPQLLLVPNWNSETTPVSVSGHSFNFLTFLWVPWLFWGAWKLTHSQLEAFSQTVGYF